MLVFWVCYFLDCICTVSVLCICTIFVLCVVLRIVYSTCFIYSCCTTGFWDLQNEYVGMNACIYVHTYVCFLCTYVCIHIVCMFVCMYVCSIMFVQFCNGDWWKIISKCNERSTAYLHSWCVWKSTIILQRGSLGYVFHGRGKLFVGELYKWWK